METVFVKTRTELQKERLRFALFVALACHALIIFGIGFKVLNARPANHTLDVTLAQYSSEKAPDKADFIAQNNQLGSGTTKEKNKLTTDRMSETNAQDTHKQSSQQASVRTIKETPVITAQRSGSTQTRQPRPEKHHEDTHANQAENTPPETLDSLKAQLDRQRNNYSKIPKVRTLTTHSTKSADEAAYMAYWIQHAEQIGNQNYPEEARRKKIYGELQLAVTLLPDGSIDAIDIIKSSGHRILDLAAMRTVRLAAPFAPFNESMQNFDKIQITRTWRYLPEKGLTTGNE